MRRSALSLVVLLVFAGCEDAGNGSSSGKGAVENPATLERCVPGETDRSGGEDAATLDSAPQNFGGLELHTNGDVVGFVEDEQCRVRVGYVETPRDLEELEKGLAKRAFEEEIPLSSFDMISDTQQFFLNNAGKSYPGDYTAKLLVKEVESLQESETSDEGENSPPYAIVELRSYREGRMISKAIFRDFSAPLGARLQLTFPATLANNVREEDLRHIHLMIDANGDSTVDETHPPSSVVVGPASGETDPPQTTATVRKGRTADEALIELASDDTSDQGYESGGKSSSGVHQIFYAVVRPNENPDSARTREYVEPFSVPLGSTVYFYSVDRAGNFDTSRQVVADERSIGTTTSEPMIRS